MQSNSHPMTQDPDNEWRSGYKPGTDNGLPNNIKTKDAIICKKYIQIGPGPIRILCNNPMQLMRLHEMVTIGGIKCASLCTEYIFPKSRFVAICRNNGNKGHCDGKPNIICKECIEKNVDMNGLPGKGYQIYRNYYR